MAHTPLLFPPLAMRPPAAQLARPRDCVLGGVCQGLAGHLGWSVSTVRWLAAGLSLCGGAGILLYLWLWALTPLESADVTSHSTAIHRRIRVEWLLLAGAAIIAVALLVVASGWQPARIPLVAAATFAMVFFAFAAVAWDQFVENRELSRRRASTAVRVTSGVFLLVMAMLLAVTAQVGAASWAWPLLTLVVVAGLVVLFGPWALRLWQELLAERTARVREEQRAEIAAHLHDSVLQTLALIQNRAGASSEVARLARAQERELRDWLYAGGAPADSDLATDLRDYAAALELDYPVRMDVVTVGEALEQASGEVAAAAREAMLNAARHAGGEVSVYLESSPTAVDVFVRDRGPGFDPATVPDHRLGVRESILGRMKRFGGSATVGAGVGGTGTEVHLHAERGGSAERGAGAERGGSAERGASSESGGAAEHAGGDAHE